MQELTQEPQVYRMPLLGDDFPVIEVQTTHGPLKLPGDYRGTWFVLFSHPADYTPVCTTEFVEFQKRFHEFERLGCKLVGMSVDQVFSHIKWVEWIRDRLGVAIQFPVIAAGERLAERMGMLHPGKGSNTVRAVFIVDPMGKTRLILYYPQEIGRNIDEIVRSVRALQVSDEQGAVPANWPRNELIGDRIIVPPATDVTTATDRVQQYDCFDWWFCHKPLEGDSGARGGSGGGLTFT